MKSSVKSALAGACACAIVGTGVVAAAPATAVQRLTTRTPSSSSVSTPLLCGDVITTDTVLHKDLIDCPDNGLVIGADGVTIDLNGHRISGDDSLNEQCGPGLVCDVGIANSGGYRDVVIENGSLRDFALGVLVIGARDSLLNHLRISQSLFSGLIVVDADNTRIEHSTVNGNGLTTDQAGIAVFASRLGRPSLLSKSVAASSNV